MRGSTLTTFLMFLPLIAIPLLAIFGVPEFTAVNASTPTETGIGPAITIDGKATPVGLTRNGAIGEPGANDVFSPPGRNTNSAPAFPKDLINSEGDPFLSKSRTTPVAENASSRGLNGWELDRGRSNAMANTKSVSHHIEIPRGIEHDRPVAGPSRSTGGPFNGIPSETAKTSMRSTQAPEPTATNSRLTWQTAVRKLNQMGVRDFLLQPGSKAEEFHFSCIYSPPENPRIAHRFEAEDSDPLLAVAKVLKQIEQRQ